MKAAYQIPTYWTVSSLGDAAFRTLVLLVSHKDGKTNVVRVTNDTLAAERGIDPRNVQSHLNQAEQRGFITKKFDEKGRRFFVLNLNEKSGDDNHQGVMTSAMMEIITPCQPASGGDDGEHQGGMMVAITPPNNPHIGTTILLNHSSQPSRAGACEVLPIGQPKRANLGQDVRTALAGWLMGDEVKFVAGMDADWTDEFVTWGLEQSKKVNIRSAAYLLKVCKNNWRENWAAPDTVTRQAAKAAEAKGLERIRNLK